MLLLRPPPAARDSAGGRPNRERGPRDPGADGAERKPLRVGGRTMSDRCLVGGSFSDETGWWLVDSVDDDGTVWLLGRDGEERATAAGYLPPLEYLEEHCNHPGGCYKPPFPF